MAAQPVPGFTLGRLVNAVNGQPLRARDAVGEVESRSVPEATSEKRPGLPEHMVCRDQGMRLISPQGTRLLVVAIAAERQRHPGGGIDEPHRP